MQTPAQPEVTLTQPELAAAFTEWDRRHREEPDRFMSEAQHLLKETPESYGEACAPYLLKIVEDLRREARGFIPPRVAEMLGELGIAEEELPCSTYTRDDAARALSCDHVVAVRLPYSQTLSWMRRCHPGSILTRSASMADSITACSGCAHSPTDSSSPAPRRLAEHKEAPTVVLTGHDIDAASLRSIAPSRIPARPTIVLVGPLGIGKTLFSLAIAGKLGCTHVIDGKMINGDPMHDAQDTPRDGALVIDEAGGDLTIVAHTQAGFDALVAALGIPLKHRPSYSTEMVRGPDPDFHRASSRSNTSSASSGVALSSKTD